MDEKKILAKTFQLIEWHKAGELGGETMPEDSNPGYSLDSKENYLYFTLPMALNYQRNSYQLWKSANLSATDSKVADIFLPEQVIEMNEDGLRDKLTKYKVALQKNKQPVIWRKLCQTFSEQFCGDVRLFFEQNHCKASEVKAYMTARKKDFPYLSGNKIMNYWLYVMTQYTDLVLEDRENISVAPDTNVIQASLKLGVIDENEYKNSNIQLIVAKRWEEILAGSDLDPIDIHTPLWLWSRGKFFGLEELTRPGVSDK